MNSNRWLARWISGLYYTAAAAAIVTGQLARGQEEPPPLPPEHRVEQLIVFDARQTRAIERTGEALLKELGPGFTVTVTKTPACGAAPCGGTATSACEGEATCSGLVVHRQLAGSESGHHVCTTNPQAGRFAKQGCPCAITGQCDCLGACQCPVDANCASECLAAFPGAACDTGCGEDVCDVALAHAAEHAEHHQEGRVHQRIHVRHEPLDLMHHLVELAADRAAARAELESRREASAKMADLYETLAELIAVNAALEAKLEAQVAHTKTLEKVAELAAENARLKAHVELASGRGETSQQMISLTLENERLKLRLADLEHRHSTSEAAQTAQRAAGDRKSR